MRLILAIALLFGASGVAVAQFAPWQPMIWAPTIATPAPAAAAQGLRVLNAGIVILH